ncbi:MAG TPA: retroviral-like aspartic protease family protein [Albitalea sp.]|nr:retroviral-like aspartic protease family protein [Albitalea sp.]
MKPSGSAATGSAWHSDIGGHAALKCLQQRALECAEGNWSFYLRLRPADANALANYGIVLTMREKYEAAIPQFEKAIDLGEGSHDIFAHYADSLGKVGRTNDAIDWSYKTLVVVPTLVDVRGSLAKLLVLQKRHHEALALLTSFDEQLSRQGHAAYFTGQRIAIESSIARAGLSQANEQAGLRLAKVGDHFFVPVTLGSARPSAFVVDTGAAKTTLSEELLENSKAVYKVERNETRVQTADGRISTARLVNIESMKVGAFALKNISALVCRGCVSLLGQASLSKFDIKSSRIQGVEFLTLVPR